MLWNEYRTAFTEAARKSGKSKEYCEKCLSYAENLWDHSMPVIYTQEHMRQRMPLNHFTGSSPSLRRMVACV